MTPSSRSAVKPRYTLRRMQIAIRLATHGLAQRCGRRAASASCPAPDRPRPRRTGSIPALDQRQQASAARSLPRNAPSARTTARRALGCSVVATAAPSARHAWSRGSRPGLGAGRAHAPESVAAERAHQRLDRLRAAATAQGPRRIHAIRDLGRARQLGQQEIEILLHLHLGQEVLAGIEDRLRWAPGRAGRRTSALLP